MTSTSVLLGGTFPLSGPASTFGAVGPGAKAYFGRRAAYGPLSNARG